MEVDMNAKKTRKTRKKREKNAKFYSMPIGMNVLVINNDLIINSLVY